MTAEYDLKTREGRAILRQLCDVATPAPWVLPFDDGALVEASNPDISLLGLDVDGLAVIYKRSDAELIASARTALPASLDYIDELEAQIAQQLHDDERICERNNDRDPCGRCAGCILRAAGEFEDIDDPDTGPHEDDDGRHDWLLK